MSAAISSCLLPAGDMYYVKPYHDLNQNPPIVEDDDDIMYKVKPINKPANLTESVSLNDHVLSFRTHTTTSK